MVEVQRAMIDSADDHTGYAMRHDDGTTTYHILSEGDSMAHEKKGKPAKAAGVKKLPPEERGAHTLGKAANQNPRKPEHPSGVAENVPESAKPGTTTQKPAQPGQHPVAPAHSGDAVPHTPEPGQHTTTEGDSTTITPDGGTRHSR